MLGAVASGMARTGYTSTGPFLCIKAHFLCLVEWAGRAGGCKGDGMTRATTEAEFVTQVLQSGGPVLVRFEAEWSAPCRQLLPIMGQLASEFANRLMVVTVDVDEQPDIAEAYGIPGIPSLVLFRNGQRVAEKHGPLPKERLSRWLEQALG
jgi:thioredoxin 1